MKTLTKTFAKRALSILLVTIMVFSLGITSIVSTSAANIELAETGYKHTGGYLYFYNSYGWSNVSMLIGPTYSSTMYTFTKLSGQLYYLDMPTFDEWHNWVLLDASGWEFKNENVYDRSKDITGKSAYQESYSFNDGSTYLLNTSSNTSSWYKGDTGTSYNALNFTQYAARQLSTDGGVNFSSSTAGGTVKITTTKLTGNGSVSTATVTATSAKAAIGTSVTMKAIANENHSFVGWYDASGNKKSNTDTLTYTCTGTTPTYYARFKTDAVIESKGFTYSEDLSVANVITITSESDMTNVTNPRYSWIVTDNNNNPIIDTDTTDSTFTFIPTIEGDYKVSCTISGDNVSSSSSEDTFTVQPFEVHVDVNSDTLPWSEYFMFYPSVHEYMGDLESGRYQYTFQMDENDISKDPDWKDAPEYELHADETGARYFRVRYSIEDGEAINKVRLRVKLHDTVTNSDYFSETKTITITDYVHEVSLETNRTAVAAGDTINLTATVKKPSDDRILSKYIYEIYVNNQLMDTIETKDSSLVYSLTAEAGSELESTFNYHIVGKVVLVDWTGKTKEYTSDPTAPVTIKVTDPDQVEYSNVIVKFKTAEAWGYRPNFTVNGVTKEHSATKAMIAKNESETATYYWYSIELGNLTGGAETEIRVTANRSTFYKGYYKLVLKDDLTISEGDNTVIYLSLDNLNESTLDKQMINISRDPNKDKCESAVNMIIDESDIASLPTLGYTFSSAAFGDANCDGKVNVRDATYIQKCLANIEEADELSTIVSDFNQDGNVTIKDATALQKQLANL